MTFTINGVTTPGLATTTYGGACTLACLDTQAAAVSWSVEAASDTSTVLPTITPGGVPYGMTATFTFPSDPGHGRGVALRVKCQVIRVNGQVVVYKGIVGVPGPGGLVPITYQEATDRGAYGFAEELNAAVANQIVLGGSVQTTTATTTTVLTIPITNLAVEERSFRVVGVSSTDTFVAEWTAAYTRIGGANPVLIRGYTADSSRGASAGASTWSASASVSGSNVLVRVTGAAGVSIRWRAESWKQVWLRASL